ncbi:hypothetical protein LCGC14_2490290 [marine sediment metagenome]|uniref:Uncharacterized protein n=1 Tax=marine sediment metagenome TaxID=412755 RepID=A0A0F9DYQ4_9ZZZZ
MPYGASDFSSFGSGTLPKLYPSRCVIIAACSVKEASSKASLLAFLVLGSSMYCKRYSARASVAFTVGGASTSGGSGGDGGAGAAGDALITWQE